jgi:hypothetical protein
MREFQRALVIGNASGAQVTVPLGKPWLKITGSQDPVNDGSVVTSVTLDPYDGIVLVRPL